MNSARGLQPARLGRELEDRGSNPSGCPEPAATVPIVLGNWGPIGMQHAAEYADHWMPIDVMLLGENGRPDVASTVERFRRQVAELRRDPDNIPVSLFLFSRPTEARIERYAALGIRRLVVSVPSADVVDAAHPPERDTCRPSCSPTAHDGTPGTHRDTACPRNHRQHHHHQLRDKRSTRARSLEPVTTSQVYPPSRTSGD